MKRILIIITSHSQLLNTDARTGVWLGEFTEPYYIFTDAGYQVTLASPAGGPPPVDAMSQLTEHITGSNRRFNSDETAQKQFNNTGQLSNVTADEYDAVFFPGGHGPIFDLADSEKVADLLLNFKAQGKPIAAVCHGSAAFIAAAERSEDFIKNKKISCFSNVEERLAARYNTVPYLLEDRISSLGGIVDNSALPFTPHTVQDGLLITGQNPLSAGPVAEILVKLLNDAQAQ